MNTLEEDKKGGEKCKRKKNGRKEKNHWASEASPTLGCSIEISRDIYICVSVVCQITWNHVNQIRACSKSVLGGKIRPVTPVLFVSTMR